MRENLLAERKALKLTQRETADRLGITKQHYQRLESGTSNGSTKIWQKLKELTGVPIDKLLEKK